MMRPGSRTASVPCASADGWKRRGRNSGSDVAAIGFAADCRIGTPAGLANFRLQCVSDSLIANPSGFDFQLYAIVSAIIAIGQVIGTGLEEHEPQPTGARALGSSRFGCNCFCGRIKGLTRIQEFYPDAVIKTADRYYDVIAARSGAAVLEDIGCKLSDAKPRPENCTFTFAPSSCNLLDPAVDGADLIRAHAEGSCLHGIVHDERL